MTTTNDLDRGLGIYADTAELDHDTRNDAPRSPRHADELRRRQRAGPREHPPDRAAGTGPMSASTGRNDVADDTRSAHLTHDSLTTEETTMRTTGWTTTEAREHPTADHGTIRTGLARYTDDQGTEVAVTVGGRSTTADQARQLATELLRLADLADGSRPAHERTER